MRECYLSVKELPDTNLLHYFMDIVFKNPYRYLGVYSNSTTKERTANKNKMNRFLMVNKPISFPLDLPSLLPDINRTMDSVSRAESELTLPIDQIRYAQFWWMKVTPLDDEAFNHLLSGNVNMAKSLWSNTDNVSSLQNRFVLSLIVKNWKIAIVYAEILYSRFSDQFISTILGNINTVSTPLWQLLLDKLIENGVNIIDYINVIHSTEWKNYISNKIVNPIIDSISNAIDDSKSSKGKGPNSRLRAGKKLMDSTKKLLNQLNSILSKSDLRYQTIVDKLAIEILQCGIDYYNDSDDDDSAYKAMELQEYAYNIAVGSMAKQRCKENYDILNKIIKDLPPVSIMPQYRAIQEELKRYKSKSETISNAISLLKATKPHLEKIKDTVGSYDSTYLSLSTVVVVLALHNVIEEVNRSNSNNNFSISYMIDSAWDAFILMDKFDMESDFKNHYLKNRSTLKNMKDQLNRVVNSSSRSSTSTNTDNSFLIGCAFIVFVIIVVFMIVSSL